MKYWAFISYSHQDGGVCDWLHGALERFRVPARLVGRATRMGTVPARLFPVFRDRDELPGSAELGRNLTEALAQSRFLIVVCSPAAARSRWVNEEIRQFKMMGGEGRVLALIVDGEPNADDHPGSGLLECFPEALKYRVDASGHLTGQRVEPIAADIRRGRENRQVALLRLVAGLLEQPFDELRQRDRERRRRALLARGSMAAAAGLVLAGGLGVHFRAERMERLEALGREALMQDRPTHAALYLAEAYRMGRDGRELRIMLDQAMRSVDILNSVHAPAGAPYVSAAFSPDGARLAAVDAGGRVHLWRADNGHRLMTLQPPDGARRAGFTADSSLIAVLGTAGAVTVFDVRTGTRVSAWSAPAGTTPLPAPAQPAGAGEGGLVLHAAADGGTLLHDAAAGRLLAAAAGPCALPVHAAGRLACARDGAPVLDIHAASRRDARAIALPGGDPAVIAAVYPGSAPPRAVAGFAAGRLLVFDAGSGRTLADVNHPGGVSVLALSADGTLVASGGAVGSVLVWAAGDGRLVAHMPGHTGRVRALHFLDAPGTPARIASLGEDGELKVWDAASGAMLSVHQVGQGPATEAAWSADRMRLATWPQGGGGIKVWDLHAAGPAERYATGAALPTAASAGQCKGSPPAEAAARGRPGLEAAGTMACDAASQWILTGGRAGDAVLWSAATREPVARFTGHAGAIARVAFLPGDGVPGVLSVAADRTATRWTVEEETRPPGIILRRIACRVPLRLEGYALKPHGERTQGCASSGMW